MIARAFVYSSLLTPLSGTAQLERFVSQTPLQFGVGLGLIVLGLWLLSGRRQRPA